MRPRVSGGGYKNSNRVSSNSELNCLTSACKKRKNARVRKFVRKKGFFMALYSELPIFQATSKFSHEYKYSLGQDMKRDALCLFRNLYRANKAKDKVCLLYTSDAADE